MFEFRDYIGNEYIRGFLQGAVRKGLDPRAILQKAGIPAEAYDDPETRIDGVQLHNLIQATKEATSDTYMGFLEQPVKLLAEFEVAKLGTRGETLGESLKAMGQFAENYRNDYSYTYETDSKTREFHFGMNFTIADGIDSHFLYFYRLSGPYKFLSWLLSERIKLTRVRFSGPKPTYCYDYRNLFCCDIQFDQPECQLCFDAKYLSLPIVRKEAEVLTYVTRYNDWLVVPGRESSVTSQVEQVLLELQKEKCFSPSIETVAKIVSLHPRTLRRMLVRENETYQKIKSRMRCNLAIKLLLTTEIPVATISERVGFAEPSDFTRAFVGWTGGTPSAYRAAYASPCPRMVSE